MKCTRLCRIRLNGNSITTPKPAVPAAPLPRNFLIRKSHTASTHPVAKAMPSEPSISSRRPIKLILDFDGTLTLRDTLHLVAAVGYDRQRQSRYQDSSKSEPTPWSEIVDAYMTDLNTHTAQYKPEIEARTKLTEEVKWLDSLAEVEKASAKRVHDAEIFDNVRKQDVEDAAEKAVRAGDVKLREGWGRLLGLMQEVNQNRTVLGSTIHVVSVNWSRWFVYNTMWRAAAELEASDRSDIELLQQRVSSTEYHVNEIPSVAEEMHQLPSSTRRLRDDLPGGSVELRTSGDKLQVLEKIRRDATTPDHAPIVIYVGDSTTDLECLVAADVGICIQDERDNSSGQKELGRTCQRIGYNLLPINSWRPIRGIGDKRTSQQPLLFKASDFEDICTWLKDANRHI